MSTPQASDLERYREQMRKDWAGGAAAWRTYYPLLKEQSRAATEAIFEAARIRPGMQVLDIASGPGEPALTIAERIGASGSVTATDLVPEMLAAAEENARSSGLTNITFQQANAEALPFADEQFDVVTCRFGVMFFPDVQRGLGEIRRVLKPDGRAALVAWGPLAENPFFSTTLGVLMRHVQLPPPEPGAPTPFRFAQAGTLTAALQAVGFREVQEEYRTIPWPTPGPAEYAWQLSRELAPVTFGRIFGMLTPAQIEQVTAEALDAMRAYEEGNQLRFQAVIVVASAVR